jgi:hypothetical protein
MARFAEANIIEEVRFTEGAWNRLDAIVGQHCGADHDTLATSPGQFGTNSGYGQRNCAVPSNDVEQRP